MEQDKAKQPTNEATEVAKEITPIVIDQLNDILNELHAPTITSSPSGYDRANDFVEFNKWLTHTDETNVKHIAADYGLLPITILLSGVDTDAVALLQGSGDINMSGFVRYLTVITQLCTTNAKQINDLNDIIFGDILTALPEDTEYPKLRSQFVTNLLSYFINTNTDTPYEDAMSRVLTLLPVS